MCLLNLGLICNFASYVDSAPDIIAISCRNIVIFISLAFGTFHGFNFNIAYFVYLF